MRHEAAKLILETYGIEQDEVLSPQAVNFSDLSSLLPHVALAAQVGFMDGYADQFGRPLQIVGAFNNTFIEEAMKMTVLAAGYCENLNKGDRFFAEDPGLLSHDAPPPTRYLTRDRRISVSERLHAAPSTLLQCTELGLSWDMPAVTNSWYEGVC